MGIKRKIKHAIKPHKKMTVIEFEKKFDEARKKQPHVDIPKVMVLLKDRTSFLASDYKIYGDNDIDRNILVDLINNVGGEYFTITVPLDDIRDVVININKKKKKVKIWE